MRCLFLFLLGLSVAPAILAAEPMSGEETPKQYILNYPTAEQFCPPVSGYFQNVVLSVNRVGSRTFAQKPNGGYGLPIQDRVGDQNLIHVGVDVGWYREGHPVYAVANGVVRISEGSPVLDTNDKTKAKAAPRLEWGNVLAIEHRSVDDQFVTTIYGHLDTDLLVKPGDIVRAGQQIGRIGRTRVNGGYKPHLHFGVRVGRLAEVGRKVFDLALNGRLIALRIAELGENVVVLEDDELPDVVSFSIRGQVVELVKNGDRVEAPARMLVNLPSAEFPINGYGLSTEGWLDPTDFLRSQRADSNPARFEMDGKRRPREK